MMLSPLSLIEDMPAPLSPGERRPLGDTLSALRLDSIQVSYDGAAPTSAGASRAAVDGFSLVLNAGDIACLLGPSGCGKTTVLRAIAGFEPLRAGSIRLGHTTLSSANVHLPPEQRHVGLMFQEVALFPHLDTHANIGFGLRRETRAAREARVAVLLKMVGLPGLGGRFPHELSGGQQQRVALARALAPSPRLLLLDEPFSSVDRATRQRLVREVRAILKRTGQTALLVTHDEAEAEALADWIGHMRDGRLVGWREADSALNGDTTP